MFAYLLVGLLAAAAVHIARSEDRTSRRIGELGLLYLLVGYCGVPMLGVSAGVLWRPDRAAEMLGFAAGNPFQGFLGYAFLGMSVMAILSLRYRGTYLIAPAITWAVFFAGATAVHLRDYAARGALTHHGLLEIFVAHGLISILLVAALLASGVAKEARVSEAASGRARG